MTGPLAPGSVSLRLYPHQGLDAEAAVRELLEQGRLASVAGFDGVMTSEHHGGFAGYLPNPLQLAGWLLDVMPSGWAAPCPMLLPLRPVALVAEEAAWLDARFAGRVGVGVAAGSLDVDFTIMDLTKDELTGRFADGLTRLSAWLRGQDLGPLEGDRALARCREHPVPLVSAAMGFTAVRRAAALGVGLVFDSMSSPERCRQLVDAYHQAGGDGPAVLIRRAWVGPPPSERLERQLEVYRSYSSTAAQAHWGSDELVSGDTAAEVAERLAGVAERAGADALNLRIHVPGVSAGEARDQIDSLGAALPALRPMLAGGR